MKRASLFAFICFTAAALCRCVSTGGAGNSNDVFFPATPVDGFQVELRLSADIVDLSAFNPRGDSMRFVDADGGNVPYWIEFWNPKRTSVIWIRVKKAGTEKVALMAAEPGASPVSSGESVFDRVDFTAFTKDWLCSGFIGGRVAGWENGLTDYRVDTTGWFKSDVGDRSLGPVNFSRWFVRKEFFIAAGEIVFSGNAESAHVWSFIGSDEIYMRIAGDEQDVEGANKGPYSHSFAVTRNFGRYVWAGRGQARKGNGVLTISSVGQGLSHVFVRKQAGARPVTQHAGGSSNFSSSIFPGESESIPDRAISRGWRAWPGTENFTIDTAGGAPVLVSPLLAERQRFDIPVDGFPAIFDFEIKVLFQTPKIDGKLLDVKMGDLSFGIEYNRSVNAYDAVINAVKTRIDGLRPDQPVVLTMRKSGNDIVLVINGTRTLGISVGEDASAQTAKRIQIESLNPKIYSIEARVPEGAVNPLIDHDIYFGEDFFGMTEGAVFSGWVGIQNFKVVRDLDRIALVTLQDDREETLQISNVPFPDDFVFKLEIGLPLGREMKFKTTVKTGTVEAGLRFENGGYICNIEKNEKPVATIRPGNRIMLSFEKRGKNFSVLVDNQVVLKDIVVQDFLIGRTVNLLMINPRLYSITIERGARR